MRKMSITLKISILVTSLIAALLILAGFFVTSFSAVIEGNQKDAQLRQFETILSDNWDDLKKQIALLRVMGPEYFSKTITEDELLAAIAQGDTLTTALSNHFASLDLSISDAWTQANPELPLDDYLSQFNTDWGALTVSLADAATAWTNNASWNQRNAADKGIAAALEPVDINVNDFRSYFGNMFSLRSQALITSQSATIQNMIIVLVIMILFSLAVSIIVLRKLKSDLSNIVAMTNQLANGDLTTHVDAQENGDEVDEVKLSVYRMNQQLRNIVESVIDISDHLRASSQGILSDTEARLKDAENQQDYLHQLSTAIEQLDAYSKQVNTAAAESLVVAKDASTAAQVGSETVTDTVKSIESLADDIVKSVEVIKNLDSQAENITTVISSIQAIAEQTNLLALNAAIEAARAGEQGRGFAVVADEVRNLAARTHESTEEIQKTLGDLRNETGIAVNVIEGSHDKSNQSVEKASAAGVAISAFDQSVTQITQWTHQTANASEEQTATLSNISTIVADVNTITEENTERAKQSLASTESLNSLSENLVKSIAFFKV
ncbi:methyl-accepting chemotaxis protein [Reinekea sp.]|jgi:methyl-accepting chemotaxis protein|uniref:methyl-accepting chemotaxis protein n=1 Tax=Reinekea sp. TaxID=1970455 RepID=UPI0039896484